MFLRFSDETGPVRGVRQVEASASRVSRFHLPEKKKKKKKKKRKKMAHVLQATLNGIPLLRLLPLLRLFLLFIPKLFIHWRTNISMHCFLLLFLIVTQEHVVALL